MPSNIGMFLSSTPFIVIKIFSTGLFCPGLATRPVENVVITTNGLQDGNIPILEETTVENKGKKIKYLAQYTYISAPPVISSIYFLFFLLKCAAY